jgi:hypothetical protein
MAQATIRHETRVSDYIVIRHLPGCARKGNGRRSCTCGRSKAAEIVAKAFPGGQNYTED